jgi:hypothetical protein
MQLDIIAGTITQSLTDGAPYALEGAHGLGVPPVQRFLQSTPRRDGATDRGHTYNERVVTLAIQFTADDAAQRDERRDTLQRLFGPGTNTPLVLKATRDDGEVRLLDVVASGMSDIALDPAHDVAHLHRVVVQLRAEDPLWYDGDGAGAGTLGTIFISRWDRCSGSVSDSIPRDVFEEPSASQSFSVLENDRVYGFNGTIPITVSGSVLAEIIYPGSTAKIYAGTAASGTPVLRYSSSGGTAIDVEILERDNLYHSVVVRDNNAQVLIRVDGGPEVQHLRYVATGGPGTGYWRPDWAGDLVRTASYRDDILFFSFGITFYFAQALAGTLFWYNNTQTMTYSGSGSVLPVVTLLGPLESPILTNQTTGRKLDLTGSWIPAGVTYTLDADATGYGFVNANDNTTITITDDSNITDWYLTAGTNTIHGTAYKHNENARMTVSWSRGDEYEAY